jgi:anthranilate synthase component 2
MIDNYDSFTFNLVQYFGELGAEVKVFRNDEITWRALRGAEASGPGAVARPLLAGRGRHLRGGHPALHGQAADPGRVPGPPEHRCGAGRQASCARRSRCTARPARHHHRPEGVYAGPAQQFSVIRYHSLAIERASRCPRCWRSPPGPRTARSWACATAAGRHATPLEGVQFHPESILTEHGHAMLKNFLKMWRIAITTIASNPRARGHDH